MAWLTALRGWTRDSWDRIRGPWTPQDVRLGGTSFGWSIVGTLGFLLGPTAIMAYILGSYLRIDVAASMSQVGWDGGCDWLVVGIGWHCFGDFTSIYYPSPVAPLVESEWLYPVSTRILRLPFWVVGQLFGLNAALTVYLFASAVSILIPVAWAVRNSPLWAKGLVLGVMGIATAPFIFAWDRGNILSLTVPFVFLAILGLVKNRHWWVVIGVIASSSIKPQFAVLAFALLALRDVRRFLIAIVGSVVVVVGSYALLGGEALPELARWIGSAIGWSGYRELFWSWPGNGSIARALFMVLHLGPWADPVGWDGDSSVLAVVPDAVYQALGQGLFVVLTLLIVVVGRRLPPLAIGGGLIVMAAFFLSLSFGYYFVVVIPVAAIAFRRGLEGWPAFGARAKVLMASFGVALVLSLTPLIVPIGPRLMPNAETTVIGSVVPSFAILAWSVFLVTLVVHGFAQVRGAHRGDEPAEVFGPAEPVSAEAR